MMVPLQAKSKVTHVLSFGSGVNTFGLMVLLVREKMPFDVAVFADTGCELPETYQALDVARGYLERHGIELKVVKSKSGMSLFEKCAERKVLPSTLWRWSTRDFKITPIHAYYRSLGTHINEYLGIAYDEVERMKESREDYITSLFPLIDRKMTREDCIRLIKSARLPVPIKSGCYVCPFSPIWRWKYIHENHPDIYRKVMKLEEGNKHFPSQTLTGQTLRGLVKSDFTINGKMPLDAPCGAYCMT